MSVLIGLNLKGYVILCSDTRISWYPPGQPMRWKDDIQKIRSTSIGLIGGTGLVSLLDPVERRFEETEIHHTDDIVRVISEEYDRVREDVRFEDVRVRGSLRMTGWMFTYVGCDDLENPTLENAQLRLGIYHPDLSEEQRLTIHPGAGMALMPIGTAKEQYDEIQDALSRGLRTTDEVPDLQESLNYHVPFLGVVVRTVSEWNQSVSPSFQVGVHTLFGRGISSIIDGTRLTFELKLTP